LNDYYLVNRCCGQLSLSSRPRRFEERANGRALTHFIVAVNSEQAVCSGQRAEVRKSQGTRVWSKLTLIGWAFLALNAVGTGLIALRYGLPRVPFPTPLPNYFARHNWLVLHASFSAIALLAGPWQFLPGWRSSKLSVHRWLGRVYCIAVVAGWVASLPIAFHAQTGAAASAGFVALGVVWITATAVAYVSIRRGQVTRHREWMIRSYAATAAAITLRSYLPMLMVMKVPLSTTYPLVAWLCWMPNMLLAEWLVRHRRMPALLG
jgi:uncharacterized membrane protein